MKNKGAQGFDENYWAKNYSEPKDMDGIGNAKNHVRYLKAFLELEQITIKSMIDFGFGLGHLSSALIKAFKPWRYHGIEPSDLAFEKGGKRIEKNEDVKLRLECLDLVSWSKKVESNSRWFDLGICTSVFQYLNEEELETVLPIMARMNRYLYLTVPTDKELDRQVSDLNFYDDFAIRRNRGFYLELMAPHFTLISSRFWESKIHFNEESTEFSDFLYRI